MKAKETCQHCQDKTAQIRRLEYEKLFWIKMCNHIGAENNHLRNRTIYGVVKRSIQILRHVKLR